MAEQVSKGQIARSALANWSLLLVGMTNLGVGTIAMVNGNVALAVPGLTAGLVLALAATIDRFESLKGLGMEAKTRTLDRKIEEADEALTRLKYLAEISYSSLIDLNSKIGRWDSAPSPQELHALAEQVRANLKLQGSTAETIRAALRPWVSVTLGDVRSAIARPFQAALTSEMQRLSKERDSLFKGPIKSDDPEWLRRSAEINLISSYVTGLRNARDMRLEELERSVRNAADSIQALRPEAEQTLARIAAIGPDARHFEDTSEIRDPHVFFTLLESPETKVV